MEIVTNSIERMLRVSEVSLILGLHKARIRRLARSGDLTACKFGRLWRFERGDVEAYKQKMKWRRDEDE